MSLRDLNQVMPRCKMLPLRLFPAQVQLEVSIQLRVLQASERALGDPHLTSLRAMCATEGATLRQQRRRSDRQPE